MKDEEISMEFDAVMLNISSAFYDAEVFANGQSTGILVKDAKNIGPFPTTGEVKLHIGLSKIKQDNEIIVTIFIKLFFITPPPF